MKTENEIVQRIRRSDSLIGFEIEVFLNFIKLKSAKEFLTDKAIQDFEKKPEDWYYDQPTKENILSHMEKYMSFAWTKVQDHRGISASRSVEKMQAFLWLLGDDELLENLINVSYENYGAPKLAAICEKYNLNIPTKKIIKNMINGKRCVDDCLEGCGIV